MSDAPDSANEQRDDVREQYATTRNLAARGSFQAKYATVDWFGWLADRMALVPDMDVLDVGCGPGWLWGAQAERLPHDLRVALVDSSPGMIEQAKDNLASVRALAIMGMEVADAGALPHSSNSFDVVLLLHVLYHVGDPRAALSEAHRVLRPGGRVFVSTNTRDSMSELHKLGARAFGGEVVDPGAALFSLDDAERTVRGVFGTVERHDLTDEMTCTDPDDAVAFLLSMPPGIHVLKEQQDELAAIVHEEAERAGGVLRTVRRNGLGVGTKGTGGA